MRCRDVSRHLAIAKSVSALASGPSAVRARSAGRRTGSPPQRDPWQRGSSTRGWSSIRGRVVGARLVPWLIARFLGFHRWAAVDDSQSIERARVTATTSSSSRSGAKPLNMQSSEGRTSASALRSGSPSRPARRLISRASLNACRKALSAVSGSGSPSLSANHSAISDQRQTLVRASRRPAAGGNPPGPRLPLTRAARSQASGRRAWRCRPSWRGRPLRRGVPARPGALGRNSSRAAVSASGRLGARRSNSSRNEPSASGPISEASSSRS